MFFKVIISYVLLKNYVASQDSSEVRFLCNIYEDNTNNIDVNSRVEVIVFNQELNIICGILDTTSSSFPTIAVSNVEGSYVKAVVFNSSWSKNYVFNAEANSKNYIISVNSSDFFSPISPNPSASTMHLNYNLRWIIDLEAHHFDYIQTFKTRLVVIHLPSDFLHQTLWGEKTNALAQNVFENEISRNKLIVLSKPCQPGCFLYILPSTATTYLWSACTGYISENVHSWFTWNCPLAEKSLCGSLVFYGGLLTSNRALLISNQGLLRTQDLADGRNDVIPLFHVLNVSSASAVDWRTARLLSFPICSVSDHLNTDEYILLQVRTTSNTWITFYSHEPFHTWTSVPRLSSQLASPPSVVFDQQVRSIITVKNNQNFNAEVFSLSAMDSKLTLFPAFRFTTDCTGTSHTVLLSNHFLYVSIGACLWLSTDGGNLFDKVHTFSNEDIVDLHGCDLNGGLVILTSQSRIFWTKCGVSGVYFALDQVAQARAFVTFDPLCNVAVINNQAVANNPPGVVIIRSSQFLSSNCSIKLELVEEMPYLSYLQSNRHPVEFKIAMQHKHDLSLSQSARISYNFGNPRLFSTDTNFYRISASHQLLVIVVRTNFLIESFTSLSIHTENIGSAVCFTSSLTFIILARCQFSIQLFFNYSSFVTDGGTVLNISEYTVDYEQQNRQLLVELPENYRAPSSVAIAVPLSSNVYNVNPATFNLTRHSTTEAAHTPELKGFCKGAQTRSECNCPPEYQFSSYEEHTDCRNKVYRVLFNTPYSLHIALINTDSSSGVLDESQFYVFFEELNRRQEGVFIVQDSHSPCEEQPDGILCQGLSSVNDSLLYFMTSGKSNKVYGAKTVSVTFSGSGLFHFRITLVHGLFFCNLFEEFQVFVANPPLPFPSGTVIRISIAILMCAVLTFFYSRQVIEATVKADNTGLSLTRRVNKDDPSPSKSRKSPSFRQTVHIFGK